MANCPRCAQSKIKKGKKSIIKQVEMKEGMNTLTCPDCGFQCRINDVNINDPQPQYHLPTTPFMAR